MKEILCVERFEQAEALFKPPRVDVLRQLAEPRSCTEVGEQLNQSPQRVYYHVRKLVAAGLVEQVSDRKVRGIVEGIYRASARSYWLSPKLVGTIGRRQVRDELSLGYLLELVEEVQTDLASFQPAEREIPTIGVSGQIRVPPEGRQAFLDDLRTTLQDLFTRHGGSSGDAMKLVVACYPSTTVKEPNHE